MTGSPSLATAMSSDMGYTLLEEKCEWPAWRSLSPTSLRAGNINRGSIRGMGEDFFFSSKLCSDQLWGPSSLLYNGLWGRVPRG